MRAFISMGSNLERERNLREALRQLASAVRVLGISTVFETEPIGRPEQASYYNCVAAIETSLAPRALKEDVLRRIENRLGRVRGDDRYAARTIDLDLLLYGDLVMNEAGLEIPDPDILLRPFLAQGVAELAPDLVLPGTGTSVTELVRRRMDGRALKPLEAYTVQLRGELNHGP
jgi:2-amino-4-hydroxy-6-hydroxymethyldihydropteridine diphosphokinase